MTISLTRTSTRTSTDIPFYVRSPEIDAHIQSQYGDTGQRINATVTVSADGLVQTRESIWGNYPALINTDSDPIVLNYLETMKTYNLANGITVVETIAVI